ncbi:MAG: D-alanyl-D-alanine carboxypeptidase [Firmicutes bacterium]|nr:D-alanyl-D-alanine carboxypeptidase [Bacillota bacterium]
MRKLLFGLIFSCLLFCFSLPSLATDELELNCKSALLIDGESGDILYEQNSSERCYPASVTKLMTMTLILEAVEDGTISLDDTVTVSEEAASMGGSQVYLYAGEQRTVDEMLVAIAVGSGNDAAYAMAEYLGGTAAGFAEMMNRRAAELGMNDTHFVNPHGLHDDDHYTTAHDLGILACHAIRVPQMLHYTSIYEYEFRPEPHLLTLWNTNRLLKWYEGTDGLKTGYTEQAGRNLVATVERDGMRLISVIMGAPEKRGHFNESMKLLNYGFNKYDHVQLHEAGELITLVPVSKGRTDSAALTVSEDLGYVCEKGKTGEITEEIQLGTDLTAPLTAGETGGRIVIYRDGQELTSADLVLAEDVPKGSLFHTWKQLLGLIW